MNKLNDLLNDYGLHEDDTNGFEYKDWNILKCRGGRIGDLIIEITKNENKSFVKVSKNHNEIISEIMGITLLKFFGFHTPNVLFSNKYKSFSILVETEIKGEIGHGFKEHSKIVKTLRQAAVTLKKLHSVPIDELPDIYLHDVIEEEINRLKQLINSQNFDVKKYIDHYKITPESALRSLLEKKNILRMDTLVHGDYCLPNILIRGEEVGLIDCADVGIHDKYLDLTSIYNSIVRNYGEDYLDYFFDSYGIVVNNLNYEKINYFNELAKFSYCTKFLNLN